MQETSRVYKCSSARCQYQFLVRSDPEQGNILEIRVRIGIIIIIMIFAFIFIK
jgi:hypothetical protein